MRFPSATPPIGLVWFPEHGMGYFDVPDGAEVYDEGYWQKYQGYAATDLGRALTAARVALVQRWRPHLAVIDVGIGCGSFLEALEKQQPCFGWDVNPVALDYLAVRRRTLNPETEHVNLEHGLTFWDCLEHIKEPDLMLSRASAVFISIPLFTGPEHVLASKHFRKDEHCWYWTRSGLIAWMAARGFYCAEHNTMETLLGREDIHSFAFLRE